MALNRVGLAILTIGLLLHTIGLLTTHWSIFLIETLKVSYGLWEWCSGVNCVRLQCEKSFALETSEAFSIVGMLAAFAALAAGISYLAMGKPQSLILPTVTAVASMVSLVAIIITVTVYGAKIHTTYKMKDPLASVGYSYALSIVGGFLIPIGGSMFYVVSKKTQ